MELLAVLINLLPSGPCVEKSLVVQFVIGFCLSKVEWLHKHGHIDNLIDLYGWQRDLVGLSSQLVVILEVEEGEDLFGIVLVL